MSPEGSNTHLYSAPPWIPTLRGSIWNRFAASYAPDPDKSRSGLYNRIDHDLNMVPGRTSTWSENNAEEARITKLKWKGIPRWVPPTNDDDNASHLLPSNRNTPSPSQNQRTNRLGLPYNSHGDVDDEEANILDPSSHSDERMNTEWKTPNLRKWCEMYCAERGTMKEFIVEKQIWGWDFEQVQKAIKNAIHSTGYQSEDLDISVIVDSQKYHIRPNNWFSRAINNVSINLIIHNLSSGQHPSLPTDFYVFLLSVLPYEHFGSCSDVSFLALHFLPYVHHIDLPYIVDPMVDWIHRW